MPLFSFSPMQTSELQPFLPTNTQPLFRTGGGQLRGVPIISPGRGASEGSAGPGGTGLSGTCAFPAVVHRTFVVKVGIKPLNLHCVQIPCDGARHAVPSGHRHSAFSTAQCKLLPAFIHLRHLSRPKSTRCPKRATVTTQLPRDRQHRSDHGAPLVTALPPGLGQGHFQGRRRLGSNTPSRLPLHPQLSGHACPPSCHDWDGYTQSPLAGTRPASSVLRAQPQGLPDGRTQPTSRNRGASEPSSLCAERTLLLLS